MTQGKTTHTTNTARMTLSDIGQWIFCAETSAANTCTLVHNNTARTILLGLGYVPTKPDWWSSEHNRDATLARLYCKEGIMRTVAHPRGTMFDRNRALGSVHSGYFTRGQLFALVDNAYEWANSYLNDEDRIVSPSRQMELDDTPFCHNPGPHGSAESGAPSIASDTSTSSSISSGSEHVRRLCRPSNYFHNDAALIAGPRKRRCQRGCSAPPHKRQATQ